MWGVLKGHHLLPLLNLLLDMIKRRNLRTRNIKMLVLDEADEMLNQGELGRPLVCELC